MLNALKYIFFICTQFVYIYKFNLKKGVIFELMTTFVASFNR